MNLRLEQPKGAQPDRSTNPHMNLRLGQPKGTQPGPSSNADHPLHHTLV